MQSTGLIPRAAGARSVYRQRFRRDRRRRNGCASVTAFDICPHAVRALADNAVGCRCGGRCPRRSWIGAVDYAPFDVVVSNPPYVPTPPVDDTEEISPGAGPSWAWNAGPDGRLVLDPLCESAPKLLCDGGSLLLVHSALCRCSTVAGLACGAAGMNAESGCLPMDTVRPGAVGTGRGGWRSRPDRARMPGRGADGDPGGEADDHDPGAGGAQRARAGFGSGAHRDARWRVVESDRFMVAICTCRRSEQYPLCDTSHRRCRTPQRRRSIVSSSGRRSDVCPAPTTP